MSASVEADRFAAGCAWIDGGYVPIGEARIPILDAGFARSDLTYDVVGVWRGSFFRLDDHLARLRRGTDDHLNHFGGARDRARVHDHPANVREFDEDHVAVLAGSIRLRGLIVPLVLQPVGERFELVAGFTPRRLPAH